MSAPLWTGKAFQEALKGRPIGELPSAITGLSIDTRTLKPGEAVFAIKGDRFDGHNFLTAAAAAGASVLVVSQKKLPALGKVSAPVLVVEDVLAGLGRLAAAARARSRAEIVAVTGSVGKTTTKEALRVALGASGTVHASSASFNNHWGVPLSLARLPEDADYAVFEIGMNHPNEIRPLVKLVRPHAAIVTLIAPAHLGFFSGLDEIAKAKGEIFEGVEPGGTAIVNADDPHGNALAGMARAAGVSKVATFGEAAGADVRLLNFSGGTDGSTMTARVSGTDVELNLKAPGRHIAQNVLAVLAATEIMGADVEKAATALSEWTTGKGRGARATIETDGEPITLIDESYNANPASMRAALESLGLSKPAGSGRRVAVLGDMLELGGHSRKFHSDLARPLAEARADAVFLVGPEIRTLSAALPGSIHCEWHQGVDEVEASLRQYLRPGDVVVVKASLGIGLGRLVERLTGPDAKPLKGAAPANMASGAAKC